MSSVVSRVELLMSSGPPARVNLSRERDTVHPWVCFWVDDELSRSLIQTSPVTRRSTEQRARRGPTSNNKTKTCYRVSDETERRREICQAQDHRIYDRSIVEFSEKKPESTKETRRDHETSIFLFFSFSCSSRSSGVSFQADTFPLASCRKIRGTRSGIDQQMEFPRDTVLDLDQRLLPCHHEHCRSFIGNPLFLIDHLSFSLYTDFADAVSPSILLDILRVDVTGSGIDKTRPGQIRSLNDDVSISRFFWQNPTRIRSLSRQKFTHEDVDVVP